MNKRYVNFDYLRGLAILAVMTIHVTAPTAVAGVTSSILLNQTARFGVPVFIFLSGWGLTVANSYQRADGYVDFLKKRLSKLLPAYLLWNLIYLAYRFFIDSERIPLSEAVVGLLRGTNAPHLYFVPLIVLFYLAYPILFKMGQKDWGLLMSVVITTFSLVMTWGVAIEGFTRNHNPFNWLFYFVFGIWIATQQERIKAQLNHTLIYLLLFISLANVLFEPIELTEALVLTQTRLSIVVYSVLVILAVMLLPKIQNRFTTALHTLGKHSYSIYLSHYLFIWLFREWFPQMAPLVMLFLVLFSSVLFAKLAGLRGKK